MLFGKSVLSVAIFSSVLFVSLTQAEAQQDKSKSAKPPAFQFRGASIGEPIETRFPYWAQGFRGLNLPYCSQASKVANYYSCEDPTIETKTGTFTEKKVGDVPVLWLKDFFLDGKLVSIDMIFKNRNFAEIKTMLEGRYGAASNARVEKVQNRAGATFDNIITEWKFKEGTLRLTMRYGNIDTSYLEFDNPVAKQAIALSEKAVIGEKGRQGF